jgi:nucleoside-diphosphate-sugar epimerase
VQRMLDGAIPGSPRLSFGIVDARDVADLHLRAMTHLAAKGQRFLAVAGDFMTMQEIAQLLKARMGEAAARVPTRVLPDWLLRMIALVDPLVEQIVSAKSRTPPARKPGACSAGDRDRTKMPSSPPPKA